MIIHIKTNFFYYNMISKDITKYILDLEKPKSQCDCLNNFKIIYKKYSINDWINSDLSFEIVNFIMLNRPDLLSLAIRINVQINLFLRTINKFSNNPKDIFNKVQHSIGCFALTEKNTGVLSGLFLDTEFEEKDDCYILNTNDTYKNWISQGNYSDYSIVFAINKINKKDMRIFLVNMYDQNILKNKITGLHVCDTLDLAEIKFNNLIVPKENLLEKSKGEKKINLLNGIFYGRYMIAEATVSSILGFIYHIEKNIINEDKFKKLKMDIFLNKCKKEYEIYKTILKENINKLLITSDVLKINCYKIFIIENSIEIFNKLNIMFGTRALNYDLTYENLIFNKIAEGDTTVLRLSLVLNHIKGGMFNIILRPGLSISQILNLSILKKDDQFDYILENLKEISDNIINDIILDN